MGSKRLGLIAGNGKFPILFAQRAKSQGFQVIAAAIRGDTSLFLKPFVDKLAWFKAGELQKLFSFFKDQDVQQVIMAGQVNQNNLFDPNVTFDDELQSLFQALKDRKADTIFTAVADKLKEQGLELVDSTFLIKEYLAPKGILTQRKPTEAEQSDIEFGRTIAKAMGGLDVGQTVVIKDKAIVAIEAMEGTDQTILRGGKIARTGSVVVKTSKPNQDMRFDVPVIGPRTLRNMIKSKANCLAIEAEKTIVIDLEICLKLANKNQISIIST